MKCKFIPEEDAFDLSEWTLPTLDEAGERLENLVRSALAELLEVATKENVAAYFSGDDPLDVIVAIPIARAELEEPRWTFNLRDLVRSEFEGNAQQVPEDPSAGYLGIGGGYIDEECRPEVMKLRDALRELADEVDAALNRPPPP